MSEDVPELDRAKLIRDTLAFLKVQENQPRQLGFNPQDSAWYVFLEVIAVDPILNDVKTRDFRLHEAAVLVAEVCRLCAFYRDDLPQVPFLVEYFLSWGNLAGCY